MPLSDLPSLQDRPRQSCPKGPARVEIRTAKVQAKQRQEQRAKSAVWARAKGQCERCGKHVQRGVDSLTAGHVHHRIRRSKGGTWNPKNLELLCAFCHANVHGQRTGKAKL